MFASHTVLLFIPENLSGLCVLSRTRQLNGFQQPGDFLVHGCVFQLPEEALDGDVGSVIPFGFGALRCTCIPLVRRVFAKTTHTLPFGTIPQRTTTIYAHTTVDAFLVQLFPHFVFNMDRPLSKQTLEKDVLRGVPGCIQREVENARARGTFARVAVNEWENHTFVAVAQYLP